MKPRTTLAVAAVALTGLTLGLASPASAADTSTTFTLSGGSLTLTVQPDATLTGAATGTTAITGTLGSVSVNDARGGATLWGVTAASAGFTGAGPTLSTNVSYTAGAVVETGTITVADGTATTLSATAASVVAPTALSGNNTATWTPTLNVTIPAGALVGAYTGTVTTSVT